METHAAYTFDVLLSVIGLHFTTYLIYGRVKKRALVGNYKPGAAGYDAFRKIVNNNKYLATSIVLTVVFIAATIAEGLRAFDQTSSHIFLVAIPIIMIILLLVSLKAIEMAFGKNRSNP
jgi:hypothetical protein